MRRLYFRIYLAVLASIALFALLAGLTWRVFAGFEPAGPRAAFYVEAAERLVPPADAAPEAQQRALDHWRGISGYELALFAPDGRLLAQSAEQALPFPGAPGLRPRARPWHGPFGIHAVELGDGRWLVAARPRTDRGVLARLGWLAALLGIGCAVGIAAYPVVRRLTRGLEQLEASVEALGSGRTAARVHIKGRDEVARLAEKFNQSAARIEQLIAASRSLLANASHELRSPLARLRMGIEGIAGAAPAAAQTELARNIRELDQLIDEILLASRLDAQAADRASFEPIDLVALAAEECARAGADLLPAPAGGISLVADPRLLRRLIRNLLDNARRHGGGSAIEIELRSGPAAVEIDVLDRGPGIPEAERERIFEPFYRPPGTREREGSVGLGLSLVRQIAARHGGTVAARARTGGGSCVRVTLALWPPGTAP